MEKREKMKDYCWIKEVRQNKRIFSRAQFSQTLSRRAPCFARFGEGENEWDAPGSAVKVVWFVGDFRAIRRNSSQTQFVCRMDEVLVLLFMLTKIRQFNSNTESLHILLAWWHRVVIFIVWGTIQGLCNLWLSHWLKPEVVLIRVYIEINKLCRMWDPQRICS